MIKIIENVNANKLHDELIASGVTPIMVLIRPDESVELMLSDDIDMTAVQAIIDAHNPAPLPPQPTSDDYLIDLDFRLSMIELGL